MVGGRGWQRGSCERKRAEERRKQCGWWIGVMGVLAVLRRRAWQAVEPFMMASAWWSCAFLTSHS